MKEPLRVLLAEDEENVRFVVSGALALAGYEVTEAETGTEALRIASQGTKKPDLVILDVMMPGPSGFQVCERMRTLGLDTPVIFLTARDATEDRVRGITLGGDDYLTKPFSVEELVARVGAIMRRSGKAIASDVIWVGDVRLDDAARVVTKDGEEIALSPTEYKLLRFFMRNAGRALSRGQIVDHVWDYDFGGDSTVVESFISQLRKKLHGPTGPYINTVRGFGYRLDPG